MKTTFRRRAQTLLGTALLLSLLFAGRTALAWPPTFGPEFNFSSHELAYDPENKDGFRVATKTNQAARDRFANVMKEVCASRKDCSLEEFVNHYGTKTYRVNYNDGFWFQINTDPSVLEVQAKPSTVDEIKAMRDRIQNDIFGTAKKVGLDDATRWMGTSWAGGHIHIGTHSAGLADDPRLFRNFMVDYANHPELATGVFASDQMNAPPLQALSKKAQGRFWQIIRDFDNGKIEGVHGLASSVSQKVFSETVRNVAPPQKYQAFNVTRIVDENFANNPGEQTVEIRGMRAQASADEYILETELLQKRIEWLKTQPGIIAPDAAVQLEKLTDREIAARFYDYVTQTGLPFGPYKRFLSPSQQLYVEDVASTVAERVAEREKVAAKYFDQDLKNPVKPPVWSCVTNFFRRIFPVHAH